MPRRAAGVAEREAADRAAARADAPVELPDAEVLDPDLDRQREARAAAERRPSPRSVSSVRRCAPSPRTTMPRDRSAIGFQVSATSSALALGVGSAPRDAPDAHGVEQRAGGAVDLERAAAPRDELAHDEVEAGLPREKDVARADERGERARRSRRARARASGAQPAPASHPAMARVRSGMARCGHRAQNVRPTEKWTRTLCTSWP